MGNFWYGIFVLAILILLFLFLFSNQSERKDMLQSLKKWYLPESYLHQSKSHGLLYKIFHWKKKHVLNFIDRIKKTTKKTIDTSKRRMRSWLFKIRKTERSDSDSFIKKVKDSSNNNQDLA